MVVNYLYNLMSYSLHNSDIIQRVSGTFWWRVNLPAPGWVAEVKTASVSGCGAHTGGGGGGLAH